MLRLSFFFENNVKVWLHLKAITSQAPVSDRFTCQQPAIKRTGVVVH
jgi:hypothetical protein